MTSASSGKHDKTIDKIVERLEQGDYHQISKNLEYFNPDRQDVVGEIDTLAFKINNDKSYLLLFEVKTTDRQKYYNHAVKQLDRSEKHYHKFADRIFKFYVTPNKDGTPNYRRVKNDL